MNYRIDPEQVRLAFDLFLQPGQVTEIRCLNAKVQGEWRTGTFSGYFDQEHVDDVYAALQRLEAASACYFVPNAVNPALLGRACNRARLVRDREPTTTDRDVIARRWLLIDVDPVRPAGVSSTDQEKQAARSVLNAVQNELWEKRFPSGIVNDSGNGWHLMIPADETVTDAKCKAILHWLAREFNTEQATVDTTVFNAARIWKLPGTLVCKGDHAPQIGRPWRMASVATVCEEVAQC